MCHCGIAIWIRRLLRLDSRFTEFPRNREIRIGLVRAESSRLYTSRQDVPERGIALRDSVQHRPDRLGDALPGPFRRRSRPPITSTEPHGAREFRSQRIDLLLRPLGTFYISCRLRFFQIFVQLGEPAPVSDLGLIVEHLARVAETADMNACLCEFLIGPRQACRLARFVLVALARDSARQIEHVEFGRGMTD